MNVQSEIRVAPTQAALIDGKWCDTAESFEVRNPHDGSLVAEVGLGGQSEVDAAVAAARAAQPAWAALSVIERAQIMRRIHQIFLERAEPIAQKITQEIGKTITDAREEVFEYSAPSWAKSAEEILRHRGLSFPSTQERTTNKRLVMNHRPLGVVAAITPYNFPTDISSIALAHIVAAGNCVIWKPSEYAAVSCAMLADVFKEAGVPDGVINVVQGKGEAGAALVNHKGVDGVFFTGSTATGRKIAEACALRPHLLELGGDGPFIILPDADIDAAVDGAMNGCFYYSGQVCTSAERLLVHEAVYDEFLEKFRAKAAALKIGDPMAEDTEMGPLCNADTLARVKRHVDDARAKGATIEQFGKEEGLYFPATILTDVTLDMEIMQEETFGPVAPIYKIRSAEEAIDIAHMSGLGLIASLWTQDLATAWRVGEALPHGSVNINETSNYWDQLAPFGGAGQSGVGRELSQWFLETFTEKKLLVFDLGGAQRYDRRAEGGW
ncbi:aldehyde dehydrogenase family protein [Jannaschia aquimarina]|uniref:GabD protein n=1 Tax=Jannaschia aquimarina TaxID=935700 RepID=A0A0D1CQQ2_9RHOB|nr:aldehyde dehydrogenase family protein [Jannaschia aquimarina]KIT17107.1 Succinate-semialdehyde dehydrogenase [NADP(+)] GabD [Jannaschia aquimarina]SNS46974.1 succinate-semialdehyde dehydrogenase / glutarate-semialdehyde dehydrogenase [Jannaschia aquimarina]